VDRLTRKELKTDRFALEVEHGFDYFSEHQREITRYGTIALIIVALVVGYHYYGNWREGKQQQALNAALEISNAYVGDNGPPGGLTYPTAAAKEAAETGAFTELAQKYPGTDVGTIATYHLGMMAADKGKMAEAEKYLKQAADGPRVYASLAKLALARIYGATGKLADAEKLCQSLIDHPTILVSKEQAIVALAEIQAPTKPAEARKLLEPLRTQRSAVSRTALTALGELSGK
jgi:predicted negative regulator of RcsB-dependent stress response